jgi:hypothetical protein
VRTIDITGIVSRIRFAAWRCRRRESIERGIAYLTRAILGNCPHRWEYETTRFNYCGNDHRTVQSCRWCGLRTDAGAKR